ncbi:MAG: peptidase T [Acidaminococcus sp.]|nr:peptidase T [Acidaminococcus sp.]MCI2114214.1 peptidase T [Acidaminococcus sp.]MCI2116149.1 peptidase T [Acidaminococcus sp.]
MREALLRRFLRYVQIPSQSKSGVPSVPSTKSQWDMAHTLQKELTELGLTNIYLSPQCVLTAKLPSNLPLGQKAPAIGFCTHMDTADAGLSPIVHPRVISSYDGKDIVLNREKNIVMTVKDHPELLDYIGQELVVTDGTSVLGSDNKAAVANVMTALDILVHDTSRRHGDIYVAFVPDEEVGLRGSKALELERFPVEFAYTIDCCALGEVVYETFNAGSTFVTIHGVNAHPMSAKGKLVNPTLLAVDFVNLFDRRETPECTEGKEGYLWVKSIRSNASTAEVRIDIRDHDKAGYEEKKNLILKNADVIRKREPRARIEVEETDVYANIADAMTAGNKKALDVLYSALDELSIKPNTIAMRGGTDGSYLSSKGIFTPNYFTGGLNFHSPYEFLPTASMEKSCQVTLALIDRVTKC